MFVVFDLDGTLANCAHRVHFLTSGGPADWRSFYAACEQDTPIQPMLNTLKALLAAGAICEIWTGRAAEVVEETLRWLDKHDIDTTAVTMRMRPVGDHQEDVSLKLQWLNEAAQKPDLVFEDRASVVAMWREQGILCAQVAEGNF